MFKIIRVKDAEEGGKKAFELIKEGMTGEFFEPGNQKELEEKIRNLWGDSERLEEYTRNCKETDFLNLDEYCEKLLQMYGGLKA